MVARDSWAFVATSLLMVGCGDGSSTSGPSPGGGGDSSPCPAGETLLADGSCHPAGLPAEARPCPPGEAEAGDGTCCAAGTLPLEAGGCLAAGIRPSDCAEGFEPDVENGCAPVLPSEPCAPGTMAVPGETTCQPLAPCGSPPWGNIPVDGTTQYVDQSYAVGNSDGSAARPWPTIAEGISAAGWGDVVAIAEGSYGEELYIDDKPVRLWGRCPELVDVVSSTITPPIVVNDAPTSGTELHGLALRGGAPAFHTDGAQEVLLDRIWIHDSDGGLMARAYLGEGSMRVQRSLIEDVSGVGMRILGQRVTIEECVIRDVTPSATPHYDSGVLMQPDGTPARRPEVAIDRSIVRNVNYAGVGAFDSDLTIDASVVTRTKVGTSEGSGGYGVYAATIDFPNQPSQLTVRRSVLSSNRNNALVAADTHLLLEYTAVIDTLGDHSVSHSSEGVLIFGMDDVPTTATVRSCLLARNGDENLRLQGAMATLESTIVRDAAPVPNDPYSGLGMRADYHPDVDAPSDLTVISSLVEGNSSAGIFALGSTLRIHSTVVQDTNPEPGTSTLGEGIAAQRFTEPFVPVSVEVRSSVVQDNHYGGITVHLGNTVVEDTIVRRTRPQPADQDGGVGVAVFGNSYAAPTARPVVTIAHCLIETNRLAGVLIDGSEASIEATVIRDNEAPVSEFPGGNGIHVQANYRTHEAATVTVSHCEIDHTGSFGVRSMDSDLSLLATRVTDTASWLDGLFGDGVSVMGVEGPASLSLTDCWVQDSVRAGLSAFASQAVVRNTLLECNTIHLDAETLHGVRSELHDGGGNRCGCSGAEETCRLLSASLEAPDVGQIDRTDPDGED